MPRFILRSVETNSGFLENAKILFLDGLNCIIGARGTCKTTVVESIRFAFDHDSAAIAKITKPRDRDTGRDEGIIPATLGSGSVTCTIDETGNGVPVQYTIQRELGAAPRLLRNGNRDPVAQPILSEIEIYSQGDLQMLASEDQQQRRLNLIDRPNRDRISALTRERSKIIDELRLLGSRLRLLHGEIDNRRVHVRDINEIRAELVQLLDGRPEMPPSLELQHNDFLKRQRLLDSLRELRGLQLKTAAVLGDVVAIKGETTELRDRLKYVDVEEINSILPLVDEIDKQLEGIKVARFNVEAVPVTERQSALEATFAAQDDKYYEQRQRQQTVSESLKREETLRRRLDEIGKLERELITLNAQQTTFADRRKELRAQLLAIRDDIFDLRVAEALRINEDFGDVILLTVKRAAYSPAYIHKIGDLIGGSRIRSQDEIAKELATHFFPSDLLDIIEAGDAQRVGSLLERDLGQMTRVITYLRDHANLYDLEGEFGEDTLEITMFDNGVAKQVEQLSKGQRATALLPLILRGSSAPLIIDQPEDDLDNSFIYHALVQSVRSLQLQRQLIFVTHNANIPVLGEADRIIVMEMASPTKALTPRVGNLDERKQDVLDLLEGGKEAFEQREERYHDLLS